MSAEVSARERVNLKAKEWPVSPEACPRLVLQLDNEEGSPLERNRPPTWDPGSD